MSKKRKLKKKVVVLIILIIVLIVMVLGFFGYKYFSNGKTTSKQKVVDSIPEYGYTLENDQPKIYKDLFKNLYKVLKEDEVNEEEYAKLVGQMFAVDFYNLDNKTSKNDIGGLEFITENTRENFSLKASDTVYKYVEQNLYGDRKQNLPIVTDVSVTDVTNSTYKYKNISDDKTYVVKVSLTYKEDLGYPKEVVVKLYHNDKKLDVYQMN